MFPLAFPLAVLRRHAAPGDLVLDPFCGRGTTGYACRLLDLPSVGIDSSPVAVALAEAKVANTTPEQILRAAGSILSEHPEPAAVPGGEFWDWAFHGDVLATLCRLRQGLLGDCRTDDRKALRAVLMGALHGPQPKSRPAYLSNQSPRTYAPKPRYAVGYWRRHGLRPPRVDVLGIVALRAARYYGQEQTRARGHAVLGDSRRAETLRWALRGQRARWVVTSPPYYGIKTYIPDQWLRSWFVGGPPEVEYSTEGQIGHASPRAYCAQLRRVWRNAGAACAPGARLVLRFGGINDRSVAPLSIAEGSLSGSGWQITAVRSAGTATRGRRQALHFAGRRNRPLEEHDVWATWMG
jgi:hypothetical protein